MWNAEGSAGSAEKVGQKPENFRWINFPCESIPRGDRQEHGRETGEGAEWKTGTPLVFVFGGQSER